jgi:hypothetical protein
LAGKRLEPNLGGGAELAERDKKRERGREREGGIESEIESGCSHSVDSREARIEVAKGRPSSRAVSLSCLLTIYIRVT